MYSEYWQLERKPFEPGADATTYYPSEQHEGALKKLLYAVEQRRSCAALAGPSGVGKTLLVRRLTEQLGDEISPVAHVAFPQMSGAEFLSHIGDELGAPRNEPRRGGIDESLARLRTLFQTNLEQGRHALLIVDEAQLLEDAGLLETLRLLLNLGPGTTASMTLLLTGQMGLLSALGRARPLEERIAVRSLLRTFVVEETIEYVRHRLRASGATRDLFTPQAIESLHTLSDGVVRRIDRLADLALLVGFGKGLPQIDAKQVSSVNDELLGMPAAA